MTEAPPIPDQIKHTLELMTLAKTEDNDGPYTLYSTNVRVWLQNKAGTSIGVHPRTFDSLISRKLIVADKLGVDGNDPTTWMIAPPRKPKKIKGKKLFKTRKK